MPQYLLSVHSVEGQPMHDGADMEKMFADVDAVNDEIRAAGCWVFAGGLHPADTASVVRVTDGETVITDGPFSESKEQLGGFWVIEAADLDAALAWAAKGTVACLAPIEVRPFADDPGSQQAS